MLLQHLTIVLKHLIRNPPYLLIQRIWKTFCLLHIIPTVHKSPGIQKIVKEKSVILRLRVKNRIRLQENCIHNLM